MDTTRWTLDSPCSECENITDAKQEELVERYRELSLLVHQISGEQVEENTFNYLNSWVSDQRENVTRILILTRSRL